MKTRRRKTPNDIAYFDSQASAKAALEISIDEIRWAKGAGCPAFRSGRVYKKPLLKWLAKNKSQGMKCMPRGRAASADYIARIIFKLSERALEVALSQALSSLMKRFDAGLISSEEYFERCRVWWMGGIRTPGENNSDFSGVVLRSLSTATNDNFCHASDKVRCAPLTGEE
jgi:hypothetical protein